MDAQKRMRMAVERGAEQALRHLPMASARAVVEHVMSELSLVTDQHDDGSLIIWPEES